MLILQVEQHNVDNTNFLCEFFFETLFQSYEQLQTPTDTRVVLQSFNAHVLPDTHKNPMQVESLASDEYNALLDEGVFLRSPEFEFEPVRHTHFVSLDGKCVVFLFLFHFGFWFCLCVFVFCDANAKIIQKHSFS